MRNRATRLVLLASLAAGCTADNPEFVDADGGGLFETIDGGRTIDDAAAVGFDLAGGQGGDLASPAGADLWGQPAADLATPPDLATADLGTCGNVGQKCCESMGGRYCTAANALCNNDLFNPQCKACGGANQPCCPGNRCAAGCCVDPGILGDRVCIAVAAPCPQGAGACQMSGSCQGCGGVGQKCCGGIASQYCSQPGTLCEGGLNSKCVECGAKGQRCCDRACENGLRCNFNFQGGVCQ